MMRSNSSLRIIGAIAAKDILEAIKNKTIISVLLGMALMMLSVQVLPFLLKNAAAPPLVIYDAGDSGLLNLLREAGRYRPIRVDSEQALAENLVDMNSEVLGLVIPADFDQQRQTGSELEIDGYIVWAGRAAAEEQALDLQAHLATLFDQPVRIDLADHVVLPSIDGQGVPAMLGTMLVLTIVIAGSFLTPYLLLDEKQTRTIEFLLVSPASATEVILGKALAGLFYSLVAVGVVLVFNHASLTHWGVAILATICGAILAIAVGLLIGNLFDSAQSMTLWVAVPMLLLLVPSITTTMTLGLPEALQTFFSWLPTASLTHAYLISLSGGATLAGALPDLVTVLAWSVPIYGLLYWMLERSER